MDLDTILSTLEETGPQTGAMLVERTGIDVLPLWRACRRSPSVRMETAGIRYLRLDRNVEGYARLSPSIRREFLTYTFVGLPGQQAELRAKAEAFRRETACISRAKKDAARQSVIATRASTPGGDRILEKACFIIAGDVVYGMAHTVSRPEKSTGEMVRGSDLDIVVVAEDDVDPELLRLLDGNLHKRKHLLLVNDREEMDYLIKTVSRVRQQLRFDLFSSMVASKILDEGQVLHGSREVFEKVRDLIASCGIPGKLDALERQAVEHRQRAEERLLDVNPSDGCEDLNLFFTRAEEDEIY